MQEAEGEKEGGKSMKWFKSKKQKRIEELEAQVAWQKERIAELNNSVIHGINSLKVTTEATLTRVGRMEFTPYRVESPRTETLCASVSVPYGVPMTTEDIELRLAERLAEGVAKYMVVSKNFMKDPLADPTYKAMVKVVPFPVGERRFYEI